MNRMFVFTFIIMSIIATEYTYALEDFTPEQMVMLMKASREKYVTIKATMKANSYENIDENSEPELKSTRDIISYWTKDKSFSKLTQTRYKDIARGDEHDFIRIETYAITPEWSKKLTEVPDGRKPRGFVKPGNSLQPEVPFYDIDIAMWDISGCNWDDINFSETILTKDEMTNYYILKAKLGDSPKDPFAKLYIDASKDFIPIKKEFFKYDGTLLISYECSDFRQDKHGFWAPYQYSWSDSNVGFSTKYDVEEVVINEPVSEDVFNFTFPDGTVVIDEIANLKYNIEVVEDELIFAIEDNQGILKQEDIIDAPLAKEEKLLAHASEVKSLLETSSASKKKSVNIYLIPAFILLGVILLTTIYVRNKSDMKNN